MDKSCIFAVDEERGSSLRVLLWGRFSDPLLSSLFVGEGVRVGAAVIVEDETLNLG